MLNYFVHFSVIHIVINIVQTVIMLSLYCIVVLTRSCSFSSSAMAAAAPRDIRKQLSIIAECSVCCETFNDPRQLPCIHTYCLKCIGGFSKDRLPGDEVPCPLCRKNFMIPDGGIGSLPKNFFVQQLVDIASPLSNKCQGCSVDGSKRSNAKVAIMFCGECFDRLCESCVESHRRIKVTRTHELVDLSEDGGLIETLMKSKTIYCDKHTEEALKLYCFECKEVICMMCFVKLHKFHECSDLKEVTGEFQQQMTGDIKNMHETVAYCRRLIKGRKGYQLEFNRKLDVTERQICDRVDKLKQLIDTEKANLLKDLSTIRAERNKQMNTVVGEIEQHVSFIESMVTYTEQLRDKGTACDVAQQTNALHIRAGELMKLEIIHHANNNLNSRDVTFTPATWPTQSLG